MEEIMNRSEHIAWSKKRAIEFVDKDDLPQAYLSIVSDLQKHPETMAHVGIDMGMMLVISGNLKEPHEMRNFIDGFN